MLDSRHKFLDSVYYSCSKYRHTDQGYLPRALGLIGLPRYARKTLTIDGRGSEDLEEAKRKLLQEA